MKWGSSNFTTYDILTACECYGHTNDCIYDAEVDRLKQSVDVYGNYVGGGVCQNCRVSWLISVDVSVWAK